MFTGFICQMVWGLNSPAMGVPASNQHLHVFAVNHLSPVRASTRPLPQPARQNSKARIPFPSYRSNSCFPSAPEPVHSRARLAKNKTKNLGALRVFVVNKSLKYQHLRTSTHQFSPKKNSKNFPKPVSEHRPLCVNNAPMWIGKEARRAC